MKTMKRLGAALLAVVMVLSMGISVLADPPETSKDFAGTGGGSIVIHKYDTTGIALTSDAADGTSKSGSTVIGKDSANNPVTLDQLKQIPGIEFQIEEVEYTGGAAGDKEKPADYSPIANGISSTLTTDSNGVLEWKNLPKGIYRIKELDNKTTVKPNPLVPDFLVKLPYTDPADTSKDLATVHVYPKNTVKPPVIEKTLQPSVVDENNKVIETGNILGWQLASTIPADIGKTVEKVSSLGTAYDGYGTYVITDTPGDYHAHTTEIPVKVYYLDGSDQKKFLTENIDYKVAVDIATKEIKITLTNGNPDEDSDTTKNGVKKLGEAMAATNGMEANPKLYIEYATKIDISPEQLKALMEDPSKTNELTNAAQIDFTNASGYIYEPGKGGTTTKVYGFDITKVDDKNQTIKTTDVNKRAKFRIYTTMNEVAGKEVLSGAVGDFVVDENGFLKVAGLAAGTYYIEELRAPEGYTRFEGFLTVKIGEGDSSVTTPDGTVETITVNDGTGLFKFNIKNLKGFTLPKTGGMGTILFTVLGLALVITASVCVVVSRKKKMTV